jgi:predicted alpha/beta hydrolase family esterase
MLTTIVRISLLVEIVAYAVLGAWLHSALGWNIAAVFAASLALIFGGRLALTGLTCLHAHLHRSPRSPEQRLGPVATLAYVLREYAAMVTDNLAYLPFAAGLLRPDPEPSPAGRMPVILLHGYFSNRGYFRPLVLALESHGVSPLFVPNYRSVLSSIDEGVAELHAEVERIIAGCRAAQVVLVCHSMGGLVARRYLQVHGEGRIARLVTIASPHHGTVMSRLGIGEHARQMEQGSDFLVSLAAAEKARAPKVPTTSIYSVHDNLVSPQDTSRLTWARNIAVQGWGHVSIIGAEPVVARVLEELRAAQA